jgi:hypothetical protein
MVQLDTNVGEVIKRFDAELKAMSRKQMRTAIAQSLSRAVSSGRTEGSRQIRSVYRIMAKDLSGAIKTERATSSVLAAKINVRGKSLPLHQFKPVQLKQGVRVRIKKGGSKLIKGAFLATMASGYQGVFARGNYKGSNFEFRTGPRKRKVRTTQRGLNVNPDLSITELTTTSVPRAFGQKPVIDKVSHRMAETFEKRIAHEILRRQGK